MIDIIFESRDFIALDKPPLCLSVPSRMGVDDARPCLGRLLQEELKLRIWPVHRLDFEVSGIILFAKNERAHKVANALFELRKVNKKYEAWTEGEAPEGTEIGWTFEWRSILLRGKKRAYRSPNGSEAITRATWSATREFEGQTVNCWDLNPLTGRSHQLRFELADHGNPILGDSLYAAKTPFRAGGIALRAQKIEFAVKDELEGLDLPLSLEVSTLAEFTTVRLAPKEDESED